MKRGQLPLTALRSFEAAGRHGSFTRAAQELLVSQAAVSRQVRELEIRLGHALFERHHRQVTLTAQGRLLLDQLTVSFDAIDRLLDGIRAQPAATILSISVEPSFAACWLVPRLDRFRHRHPDIDVALDPDSRPAEFRTSKTQLAIRWSETATSWPRVQAAHLVDIAMSPVISRTLLQSGPALQTPADLHRYTLLHEDDRRGWNRWFHAAGVAEISLERGPLLTDTVLAIQAAARGHGVALANMLLAEEDLQTGVLVKPFEIDVPNGAYWLVAPDFNHLSKAAQAFANWIQTEFAANR
jgi:LysR family transcriptional regulator, glycine cleavage system transcriptional activator